MNGYQALQFFGNLSNISTRVVREKQDELLKLVGLETRAADSVKKYSKGMLQRLGLAQALLHEPKLLVLDEPTDGLDPQARAEMRQIISSLQSRGVTIFLNSHLLQEVEMICERVAILAKGHLRYCGPVDSIGDFLASHHGSKRSAGVEMKLRGPIEAIRKCFAGQAKITNDTDRNLVIVTLAEHDQTAIDHYVDTLRSADISLVSLVPTKLSLEDAFLEIVGSGTPNATASS